MRVFEEGGGGRLCVDGFEKEEIGYREIRLEFLE